MRLRYSTVLTTDGDHGDKMKLVENETIVGWLVGFASVSFRDLEGEDLSRGRSGQHVLNFEVCQKNNQFVQIAGRIPTPFSLLLVLVSVFFLASLFLLVLRLRRRLLSSSFVLSFAFVVYGPCVCVCVFKLNSCQPRRVC